MILIRIINKVKLGSKFLLGIKTEEPETVFIHIGKCAGSTVRTELQNAGLDFVEKHICPVIYDPQKKYIIVIRNPIARFISAFNWRYKLVVDDEVQSNRFPGEKDLLQKYGSVKNLAESIYDKKGELLLDFTKPEYYIHHIKEDINFYIGDFLTNCNAENIKAVIATESLKDDMETHFGIIVNRHEKRNKSGDNLLSDHARRNLKKYLRKDYECLNRLFELNVISEEKYHLLIK